MMYLTWILQKEYIQSWSPVWDGWFHILSVFLEWLRCMHTGVLEILLHRPFPVLVVDMLAITHHKWAFPCCLLWQGSDVTGLGWNMKENRTFTPSSMYSIKLCRWSVHHRPSVSVYIISHKTFLQTTRAIWSIVRLQSVIPWHRRYLTAEFIFNLHKGTMSEIPDWLDLLLQSCPHKEARNLHVPFFYIAIHFAWIDRTLTYGYIPFWAKMMIEGIKGRHVSCVMFTTEIDAICKLFGLRVSGRVWSWSPTPVGSGWFCGSLRHWHVLNQEKRYRTISDKEFNGVLHSQYLWAWFSSLAILWHSDCKNSQHKTLGVACAMFHRAHNFCGLRCTFCWLHTDFLCNLSCTALVTGQSTKLKTLKDHIAKVILIRIGKRVIWVINAYLIPYSQRQKVPPVVKTWITTEKVTGVCSQWVPSDSSWLLSRQTHEDEGNDKGKSGVWGWAWRHHHDFITLSSSSSHDGCHITVVRHVGCWGRGQVRGSMKEPVSATVQVGEAVGKWFWVAPPGSWLVKWNKRTWAPIWCVRKKENKLTRKWIVPSQVILFRGIRADNSRSWVAWRPGWEAT